MTASTEDSTEVEFRTRVIPLLFLALMRHDAETQRRGWFFEAVDQRQGGYRIPGRPGQPTIRWSLVAGGSVQVTAKPGATCVVPLAQFDASLAADLIGAWWAAATA